MSQSNNQTNKKYYDPISIANRTRQVGHRVNEHDKMPMLEYILKHNDELKTVIITKSKKRADNLGLYLKSHELSASVIHGNHRKSQYEEVATAFNTNETKILITTAKVLEILGVKDVECIINFDIPVQREDYADSMAFVDEKGMVISLVSASEKDLFALIEMMLKIDISDDEVDGFIHSDIPVAEKKVTKDKKKKPRHRSQSSKKTEKKEHID